MSRKPWSLLGLQGYFEVSCEFTPNLVKQLPAVPVDLCSSVKR